MVARIAVVLVATACGRAAVPAPAPPSKPPAGVRLTCDVDNPVEIHFETGQYELACPATGACEVDLAIRIDNCLDQPIELADLRDDGSGRPIGPDPPIACGAHARVYVTLRLEGEGYHQLSWVVRDSSGVDHKWGWSDRWTDSVHVGPHSRVAEIEKCKACNGSYGAHGLLGLIRCVCPTADGGRACRDGQECEGDCLFDHVEPVGRPEDGLGVLVGTCSSVPVVFGCHDRVPDGAAALGPRPAPEPLHRCVD